MPVRIGSEQAPFRRSRVMITTKQAQHGLRQLESCFHHDCTSLMQVSRRRHHALSYNSRDCRWQEGPFHYFLDWTDKKDGPKLALISRFSRRSGQCSLIKSAAIVNFPCRRRRSVLVPATPAVIMPQTHLQSLASSSLRGLGVSD